MLKFFNKKDIKNENENINIDFDRIPKHIAIIMDGNGRWAKNKKLPRSMGHKAGVETIRRVLKEADKIGIEYITLYAFSTENWKRPKDEVDALMKLLVQYLETEVEDLNKNNVVLRVLGDINALGDELKSKINKSIELTENNTGIFLNVAFNYGGRDEIIKAVKDISTDIEKGSINTNDINEKLFSSYLYTNKSPDPDLIIRPSGEQRISNFLLWQCAYSEFWYSNVNWPDFREEHLHKAIKDYQNRDRRFGGIK